MFLDEIDDTPLETQVKLLRVLEDRVVSRLGENEWHEVDFRIVAATNRDLRALVAPGAFGADLYERLAIVTIQLPPLRERLEDLPSRSRALHRALRARGAAPRRSTAIRADALARARAPTPWPGNIRELRNVHLPDARLQARRRRDAALGSAAADPARQTTERAAGGCSIDRELADRIASGAMNLRDEVAALERAALAEALRQSGGNAAQGGEAPGRGRPRNRARPGRHGARDDQEAGDIKGSGFRVQGSGFNGGFGSKEPCVRERLNAYRTSSFLSRPPPCVVEDRSSLPRSHDVQVVLERLRRGGAAQAFLRQAHVVVHRRQAPVGRHIVEEDGSGFAAALQRGFERGVGLGIGVEAQVGAAERRPGPARCPRYFCASRASSTALRGSLRASAISACTSRP